MIYKTVDFSIKEVSRKVWKKCIVAVVYRVARWTLQKCLKIYQKCQKCIVNFFMNHAKVLLVLMVITSAKASTVPYVEASSQVWSSEVQRVDGPRQLANLVSLAQNMWKLFSLIPSEKHVTRENWDKLNVYFSIFEW